MTFRLSKAGIARRDGVHGDLCAVVHLPIRRNARGRVGPHFELPTNVYP